MHSSRGSKELWVWIFIHSSWTLQYVSKEILFSILLEGLICAPCIQECWERFAVKNYCCVSLLHVVSKGFQKLVNNRLLDQLEKYGLFPDFQYGFRSFQSTADLLTVVSDRIAKAFNRSWATRAVALDMSKAFNRVWHAHLLYKLKSGISGYIFSLILSFLSNRQLQVVLDGKSLQECPVIAGVP